jgi:peptidyl-prolyl cis-trans isomerase A (cyclophilin A)
MRAMSLSLVPFARRPISIALAALAVVACGSGPTDGPRSPDQPLAVGGVLGDAGVATYAGRGETSSSGRGRGRGAPPGEPAAKPEGDLGDGALTDGPLTDPGPDPMDGSFSLAQATAGLATSGPLVATIKTTKGELRCKLLDDKAPVAVANFVGLARGTRPFKDKGQWVTRNAYDGTTFHRVIKGFMVQGGDPQGTGRGEPGYVFKDELWTGPGSKHDRAGLLCMANRGPDTNGMQFFITDASAPHLDRSYTIFGECSPVSVVHAIANVPTDGGDRPQQEITIDKIEISRGGVSAPAPARKATPAAPAPAAPAPAAPAPAAPAPAGKPPAPAGKPPAH